MNFETSIKIHIVESFDHPMINEVAWNNLLQESETNTIFQTWQYQKCWWSVFGRGRLMIAVATREDKPVTIAPLFKEEEMIFFVGSGGSDYLDFIGENNEGILSRIIQTVQESGTVKGLLFYHIPTRSLSALHLNQTANRLNLSIHEMGSQTAPFMDIVNHPGAFERSLQKKSIRRHLNWFEKNGGIVVEHFTNNSKQSECLPGFFSQHIRRWAATSHPSLFNEPVQQVFYRQLSAALDSTGWFCLTRIKWLEQPIAFHAGFLYNNSFIWYKPSFEVQLFNKSPGEVLLGELFKFTREKGVTIFDFGLGDEPFKNRFATTCKSLINWGLYPKN